jgi:hypothetical protein
MQCHVFRIRGDVFHAAGLARLAMLPYKIQLHLNHALLLWWMWLWRTLRILASFG